MKNRLIAGLSAVVFAAAIFTVTAEAGTKSKNSLSTEQVKTQETPEEPQGAGYAGNDGPGGGPDQGHGAEIWGADLVRLAHRQG